MRYRTGLLNAGHNGNYICTASNLAGTSSMTTVREHGITKPYQSLLLIVRSL